MSKREGNVEIFDRVWFFVLEIDDIRKTRDRVKTLKLLSEWEKKSSGYDRYAAGVYYIKNFIIPSLDGLDVSDEKLPRWVDESLFHPILEPTNFQEFSKLIDENFNPASNVFQICVVTFDNVDKMEQELMISMHVEPTILIEHEYGYNAYYFLHEKTTIEQWAEFQTFLMKRMNGSSRMNDPYAIMLNAPFLGQDTSIKKFNWKRYTKQELCK